MFCKHENSVIVPKGTVIKHPKSDHEQSPGLLSKVPYWYCKNCGKSVPFVEEPNVTIKKALSHPSDNSAWFGDPNYYQNNYPSIYKDPSWNPYSSTTPTWVTRAPDITGISHTHTTIEEDFDCLKKIFTRFRDQIASKAELLAKLMRANGAILVFDPDKETIEIRDKHGRIYATKLLNEERLHP